MPSYPAKWHEHLANTVFACREDSPTSTSSPSSLSRRFLFFDPYPAACPETPNPLREYTRIETLIRFKVYSLIKGFCSLWDSCWNQGESFGLSAQYAARFNNLKVSSAALAVWPVVYTLLRHPDGALKDILTLNPKPCWGTRNIARQGFL